MPETDMQGKADTLKTPPLEAKEISDLIERGHRAHSLVGILTVLSGIVFFGLFLYYSKYDLYYQNDWASAPKWHGDTTYNEYLNWQVRNQAEKDLHAFRHGEAGEYPTWQLVLYDKIRRDIYIVAGAFFFVGLLFLYMEKAKLRRQDLLVYRAMAREIEKLRLRVKRLDGRGEKPAGADSATAEATPPAGEGESGANADT